MPGMTGVEFLNRAKALYPDTVRMTLSGFTDLQSIIDAVNEGAIYKFLTKPWDDERLRAHVAEAFRRKELADDNSRLAAQVARANAELAGLNQRLEAALARQREQALLLQVSAGGVRELLDGLPATVIGLDPDGLLAYANEQARASLGNEDTRLGLPASPWLLALATQVEQGGRRWGAAPPMLRLPVRRLPCWVWCTPIQSREGEPRGRLLMLVPCTEEMQDVPAPRH
jgi:CheY-like chemotaxis protein